MNPLPVSFAKLMDIIDAHIRNVAKARRDDDRLGELVVDEHGTRIVNAPRRAHITLDLIRSLDWHCKVHGDQIRLVNVRYQVVGWSAGHQALIVERLGA